MKASYAGQSIANQLRLHKQLHDLKLGHNEPITKYVARTKAIAAALDAAKDPVRESELVRYILAGLPNEYAHHIAVVDINTATADLIVATVHNQLLNIEVRVSTSDNPAPDKAYISTVPGKSNYPPNNPEHHDKTCNHCGHKGRIKPDCRKFKREQALPTMPLLANIMETPQVWHRHSDGVYILHNCPTESLHAYTAKSPVGASQLWHHHFGHLGYDNMAKLPTIVNGIDISAAEFKAANNKVCEPCVMAKQHRNLFPTSTSEKVAALLNIIYMDVCGPMAVPSLGGCRYIATCLDDFSGLSIVRPIKLKSDIEAFATDMINMLENVASHKVQIVQSDNGGEYVNNTLSSFFKGKGIVHQTTTPFTPKQNGAAEHLNCVLVERTRALLYDSILPPTLWAEAIMTANYIYNMSPTSARSKTPWELFYGTQPAVSHMRVFGASAYSLIPKQFRTKFNWVSSQDNFIGYEPDSKAYRIVVPSSPNSTHYMVIVNRNVTFDESHMHNPLLQDYPNFDQDYNNGLCI